jgi:predicted amidophosphoribosyltransferase
MQHMMKEGLIACLTSPLLMDSYALTAACAFCNEKIPFGRSACATCMKKYNIQSYDLASDGCGCDK